VIPFIVRSKRSSFIVIGQIPRRVFSDPVVTHFAVPRAPFHQFQRVLHRRVHRLRDSRGLSNSTASIGRKSKRETRDSNSSLNFALGVFLSSRRRQAKRRCARDIYPLDPARIYQFYIGETTHRGPASPSLLFSAARVYVIRAIGREAKIAQPVPVPTGSVRRSSRFPTPRRPPFPSRVPPLRSPRVRSPCRFPFASFDGARSYSSASLVRLRRRARARTRVGFLADDVFLDGGT